MNPEVLVRPDICKHKIIQVIVERTKLENSKFAKIVKCLGCLRVIVIEE